MMLKLSTAVIFAYLFAMEVAKADEFRLYVNERFGVSVLVPKTWRSLPPPANGDGLVFVSPDQHGEITVSGMLANVDDPTLDSSRVTDPEERVTYQSAGTGWVVASGETDGRIFYRKSVLSCHNKVYGDLSISYPSAGKQAYDLIVKRAAGSFKGGCGVY